MDKSEKQLPRRHSRGRSLTTSKSVLTEIFNPDDVNKSQRRNVHLVAIIDSGLTSLVVMSLICAFIISLIKLWEPVKRKRPVDDIDFFTCLVLSVEAFTVLAVLLNLCISVQLMHHTKQISTTRDVLRRAEFWNCYNIFLGVLLPTQVATTFVQGYYHSGGIALAFFIARVVFLVIVNRYIKELRKELTTIHPRPRRSTTFTQTDMDFEGGEASNKRDSIDDM